MGIDLSKFKKRQEAAKAPPPAKGKKPKEKKEPTPAQLEKRAKRKAYFDKIAKVIECERTGGPKAAWSQRTFLAATQFKGSAAIASRNKMLLERIAHHEYRLHGQGWMLKLWPGDSKHVLGDAKDHVEGPLPFGAEAPEDWTLLEVVRGIAAALWADKQKGKE